MAHLFDSLLFVYLKISTCFLFLPLALRAIPWARQPDRHGKHALLRRRREWGHRELLHLSHRLRAQRLDFRRVQWLISPLLLHDPFHGPGRGWPDTRQHVHWSVPRTCRQLRASRHVSQSVSRRSLWCSMDQGKMMEREWSNTQENVVLHLTWLVLTASFLTTSKLWKMGDRSGFFDERKQRQMIIEEYREKVGHHEFHAAHAEEERQLLQGQLWRQI